MSGGLFKALVGAIALVMLIGFLLVGIVANEGTTTAATTTARSSGTSSTTGSFMQSETRGREGPTNPDMDLNYMSKRRVPNGPDPIHNRRAGNSRRPPGRA